MYRGKVLAAVFVFVLLCSCLIVAMLLLSCLFDREADSGDVHMFGVNMVLA